MALAAIKGEKTLLELAQQFDIHANQITQWKSQLLEGAVGVFGLEAKAESTAEAVDLKTLHTKIGQTNQWVIGIDDLVQLHLEQLTLRLVLLSHRTHIFSQVMLGIEVLLGIIIA